MKSSFLIFTLLLNTLLFSQTPEIKTELPTIIPPSPTVAALMKFEEVPVSNYTGIPDVTIPLFNSYTHSKDINFNLALKYHSGVGANDRASDVGLGWSLFTGGTISRIVRGLPDELLINASRLQDVRIGIYHTSNNTHINNYYYFIDNITNSYQNYYKPLNELTEDQKNKGNEYLWSVANTNKYDSEHDLWQFNFMGNSGRFYIKKDKNTNQLVITPLDDYRVKILNHYSNSNGNPFVPSGFTVFDEKGYKYIFDIIESSVNKFGNVSTYAALDSDGALTYSFSSGIEAEKPFNSSFHLSKIYDSNNTLILDYIYKNESFIESFTNSNQSSTDIDQNVMASNNMCSDFPPLQSTNNSTTIVNVKKIDYIDVVGASKIYFDYTLGRSDNNINLSNQTAFLKQITIKDFKSNFIKRFLFKYNYSEVINRRMILESIDESDDNQNLILKAKFSYKSNLNLTENKIIGKDYWGFFNLIDPCEVTTAFHKKASPDFSSTDLLEKISYPTGGYTNFEFEANTYSHENGLPVDDLFQDDQNINFMNDGYLQFSNNATIQPISAENVFKIIFYPGIYNEDMASATQTAMVQKKVGSQWVSAGIGLLCFNDVNCCITFYPETGVEYRVRYVNLDILAPTAHDIYYKKYSENLSAYHLYGGGNRIKSISYYSNSDPNNLSLVKNKKFNYNFFENINKSSGSLAFSKPVYSYQDMFSTNVKYTPGNNAFGCDSNVQIISYSSSTSGNNLIALKTGGADVGYKEVTVYEEGLGKTQYKYTSPIDYPEEDTPLGPPFIPTKNFDYKRGLLKSEVNFNNSGKSIVETIFDYDIVENIEFTGMRFRKPNGICYTGSKFANYNEYVFALTSQSDCISCIPNYSMQTSFLCGLPLDVNSPKILLYPIFEAFGWSKLKSKNTKNYYYSGGVTNMLETNETYTYNSLNKQIASQTSSNSLGENIKTNYYYHSGNSVYSQNRISEIEKIETFNNSMLLSTNKIDYSNTWASNQSYLPKYILTSKGTNTLEEKLEYKSYDEFGHPLELKQSDGVSVTYIWGYNKAQPIAKIENATYAQVQQYESNLQTLSNGTDETALITALNALRTNLPSAMVTTYTYRPLIGVSTITDPKGDQITYSYDSFNRLQFVRDKSGNILSENQYNYKQ